MKRVLLILVLLLGAFTINTSRVEALDIYVMDDENCGVFGDPDSEEYFAYYLQKVFDVIKIAGPILLIVMTIMDLTRITAEAKQDGELQKLGIKTLKRVIYAVIIFVLPTFLSFVFELIGLYGTCVT